ncbi:MAG: CBS domain-containing protein [Desulfobacteraceae bacterium]|nr:CBS domain-containing protein [Desulfobacteraceae bacterium]
MASKIIPFTIIATHINADFDALGSLLAAQKLYPEALVVFPGSQEKNLRNFFVQSMAYLFNLAEIKTIDLKTVQRLVLVDTSSSARIGALSPILSNKHLDIHIYDHHPKKHDDIKAAKETRRSVGATVTLLTEILIKKKIPLTPEEATILCLGIYEDTGSFTFSSTTADDLHAAAYLVSKGANVNIISNMIAREISPEQISILNDLIQALSRHFINGVEIVVTRAIFDNYLPDFAFLVHKMVKMENIDTLFAIAMMENKVYIVARSRKDDVDVGKILKKMGGGGHSSAASASIKGQTLTQVEHQLFTVLANQVSTRQHARNLMSSPAITVNADVPCAQAKKLLTRYNMNALLVTANSTSDNQLKGFITRQVIEKAIFHNLGNSPVKDYMNTELASVSPEANLLEVQDKIIGHKQRILPVVENGSILGVITRTDLLNVLVQQSELTRADAPNPLKDTIHARTRNISNFLSERLSNKILKILENAGRVAQDLSFKAFAIGGFVRDLFLYRANEDIDIVIEGDGIVFARTFAKQFDARIHTHKKFGTAVIVLKDGFKIDIATARLEYYKSPAALPDVQMSSIKLDLFRRDFTINTLAIHLNPDKFGWLIDFFSAQKDLKGKAIRVLHNLSFVEDPTRVFRALRFEQRFGFSIGKLTASLIENAVKMDFFKRLSGKRVFSEIKQLMQEDNPVPAIERMKDYDLLKVIHPSINLNMDLIELLNSAKRVIAWHDLLFTDQPYLRWAVYFMTILRHCSIKISNEICTTMELAPRQKRLLVKDRFEAQSRLIELENRIPKQNSELYHLLINFRTELILYMMSITANKSVKRSISKFYTQLKNIRPFIDGNDLKTLGLKPGPIFSQILKAVLNAKLNGLIESRQDEIMFAYRWIQNETSNNFLDSRKPNR